MIRYFNITNNTYNNYCDVIDPSYMVEIPNDGKPYGLVNNEVVDLTNNVQYIAVKKEKAKTALVIEYAEYFKEVDRICGAKFARGLCTTEQINAQRTALQNELTTKLSEV